MSLIVLKNSLLQKFILCSTEFAIAVVAFLRSFGGGGGGVARFGCREGSTGQLVAKSAQQMGTATNQGWGKVVLKQLTII